MLFRTYGNGRANTETCRQAARPAQQRPLSGFLRNVFENTKANKEATLLAKLSHPNIVGFWESFLHGPSGHMLCIVMDYADGGDLSTCLRKRNGRLLEEEVILDW